MNAEKFDKIVEARANERAQEKIATFKSEITKALTGLVGGHGYSFLGAPYHEEAITALLSVNSTNEWPSVIWDTERKAVTSELLATMNEFQKALMAADKLPSLGDAKPSEVLK